MNNVLIKELPTETIIILLADAYNKNDQKLINVYSYALAFKINGIKGDNSFMSLMKEFGYKNKEDDLKLKKK